GRTSRASLGESSYSGGASVDAAARASSQALVFGSITSVSPPVLMSVTSFVVVATTIACRVRFGSVASHAPHYALPRVLRGAAGSYGEGSGADERSDRR